MYATLQFFTCLAYIAVNLDKIICANLVNEALVAQPSTLTVSKEPRAIGRRIESGLKGSSSRIYITHASEGRVRDDELKAKVVYANESIELILRMHNNCSC
jgi:hypothetical protein